jgi:hypothetical protein
VTGKTKAQPVLATITGTDTKHLVQITVTAPRHKAGKHAKSRVVIATDNHPFWTERPGQWTQAGQLEPGMWLRTSAGAHVQITAIKTWTQHQSVHNLTVNKLHTYYVQAGTTPVLVHNACGPSPAHVAATADVSSTPNQAVFWSGLHVDDANAIAHSMGGETLESLTEARGIAMPQFVRGTRR